MTGLFTSLWAVGEIYNTLPSRAGLFSVVLECVSSCGNAGFYHPVCVVFDFVAHLEGALGVF